MISRSNLQTDASEVEALRERIRRLEKINAALIDRVERSTDIQSGAYSMFETAISLEAMVRDRTQALETALEQLANANADLASANADANAARGLLRDAIESLDDGFALFDPEDRMVMCNRAFLTIWPEFRDVEGASPHFAELIQRLASSGRTLGSIIDPERWAANRMKRHQMASGTHIQPLSDGRWLQINEMRTSDGGIVGIYTDITSVKAEDARLRARELAERNLLLQTTLDTLSEGVCLFGPNGILQAWNDQLLSMLGIDQDPLESIATHEGLKDWCIRKRGLENADSLAWHKRKGKRHVSEGVMAGRHYILRSVTLNNGGMVFTFEDVTDRVRFQRSLTETAETLERRVAERTAELIEVNRQLVEAKNEAESANRSKTRFLAAASHDLLQPLNAARLFVSALEGQALPPRPASLVGQASTALDSVEDLLEALFEISRLDAGAVQPVIEAFPLAPMLSALRVEYELLATSGGLVLDVQETDAWVRSDMRLLRRVLQNLLSNAIRYTNEGRVDLEVSEHEDQIVLTVRDTGPGIAPEDRERIFQEFLRLDATRKVPGKGLGLATVRRVSRMLGHEIDLQSAPGKGAAFSLTLPATPPELCEHPTTVLAMPGRSEVDGLVLVIDNDPSILAGMEALLENWGLDVITVGHQNDPAVMKAMSEGPSLVLIDYHLDDEVTGDQVVARLREQGQTDLPAIVITADRSDEVKASLADQGLPMLNKPVKPAQMRALLRQLEIL